MTDPRETLSHGTLSRLSPVPLAAAGGMYPRTTKTHPDKPRYVYVTQFGGGYQIEDQTPFAEGELLIHYYTEFGVRLADLYVGIDINGTLEWKRAHMYNFTSSAATGERF